MVPRSSADITAHRSEPEVRRERSSADSPAARQNLRPEHVAGMAPFVAWMATQTADETERRRHREETEAFLRWQYGDPGPASGSRRRYEAHLANREPDRLAAARAGLDRFAEYRIVRARTLPFD